MVRKSIRTPCSCLVKLYNTAPLLGCRENTELENADIENTGLEDLEYVENVVCVLTY